MIKCKLSNNCIVNRNLKKDNWCKDCIEFSTRFDKAFHQKSRPEIIRVMKALGKM